MKRALAFIALAGALGAWVYTSPAFATAFDWPNTGSFGRPRHTSRPAFLFAAGAASAPSTITPSAGPTFPCLRTSTGTYQTSATALATAASGTCRVDYRGLLVEQSSTNQFLQSAIVANAAWSKSGTPTTTANSCVAPDGTTTLALVNSATGSTTSAIFQNKTITSSTGPFVTSAWIVPVSGSHVGTAAISCNGAGNTPVGCSCAVSSGTCTAAIVGGNNCAAYTTSVGLVRLTAITSCTSAATAVVGFVEAGQYGASTDSICIGDAQFELLNLGTSYADTTTTAVTRAPDQIDVGAITLSATPSLSATVNLEGLPASGTATALAATDGTTALILAVTTTGAVKCSYGATSDTTTGTIAAGTASKIACKYDGATLSACIGSTCHGTAATLSITAAQTHFRIGWDGTGNYLNGFASALCASKRSGGCS